MVVVVGVVAAAAAVVVVVVAVVVVFLRLTLPQNSCWRYSWIELWRTPNPFK